MQIRELSKPVTSKALNESLANKFGYKLKLEQFTDVQLEDVRNRLRTEISQFEVSESFDGMNENSKYQKTRALLDVINQEIMERAEDDEKCECDDLGQKECPVHCDDEPRSRHAHKEKDEEKDNKMKKESAEIYSARLRQKAQQHVPASWIESAIKRISLGESDQEELVAELTTRYDLKETTANNIVYLSEGEEDKAKVIMATKDMVEQITGWLEDTAQLKAEQLLELMDSIRENFGSDVAAQYEQSVKPALESVYATLESSRQGLSAGLALVSGGEAPTMGAPTPGAAPEAGAAPDMGAPAPEAGAEAAPDMAAEPDRMKRESVDYSRRLGMILASKKK
jgi:hypothetical protein